MKPSKEQWCIVIIVTLCLVAYGRTFDVPFTFDDIPYLEKNPFIRDFSNYFNRAAIEKTFASSPGVLEDARNSFITRPLSYLTFSANYALHGTALTGYHIVNLLIHTINAILVFQLVQASILLLAMKQESAPEVKSPPVALHLAVLTAALFAVHPLMTSAVTYIIQRMTSLVALFYLGSVLMYAYHASALSKSGKYAGYGLSFLFCGAAMLTKESAFTLPLALLLYDLVFCRGVLRQRVVRLLPLLLTMAIIPSNVIGLENSATAKTGGLVATSLNSINFHHVAPWDYLLTQCRAVAFYLKLVLIPVGLSLEHDFPVSHSLTEIKVIASLMLHLLLLGYGMYLLVRVQRQEQPVAVEKLAGFGVVWFYLTLAVESSVIPMNEMAVEYRLYLPSVGIFLCCVCLVHKLFGRLRDTDGSWRREYFLWAPVVGLLLLLTMARNEVWRKPATFWAQTISQYPKVARPYANLADYHIKQGQFAQAAQTYQYALEEMPGAAVLYYELGAVYILSKEYEAAAAALRKAITLQPDMKSAYERLAQAYLYLGEHERAFEVINATNRLILDTKP